MIKRCNNCSNPFSTRVIKLEDFCSNECKTEFTNRQKDIDEYTDIQVNRDFKSKQNAEEKDYRLSRRRI